MTDKTNGASRPAFLKNERPSSLKRGLWIAGGIVLAASLAWGGFAWYNKKNSGVQYVTEAIKRADLAVKVSATGTLNPTNKVDLGSELSGTVAQVFVDYNDRVKKGQVLAVLDTTKLRQTIAKSQAALESATASVQQARATLSENQTKLTRYLEVFQLSGGKVPSSTEMDAARADVERAQANLASAQAAVAEAQATLHANEIDLRKSEIKSPVDGIVLSRAVDPGQTVAASLQAVTLFTIAEDLTKMELIVSVSESDVGKVKAGQEATFNVDAFPNKQFPASIRMVRVGSVTVNNVVSYETVLSVNNKDLSLLPGMTATADILVTEKENVLLLPNAALRFKPPSAQSGQQASGGSVINALMPRPPMPQQQRQRPANASGPGSGRGNGGRAPMATVWVESPQGPQERMVRTGLTDGKYTEILHSELKEGDAVIINTTTVRK